MKSNSDLSSPEKDSSKEKLLEIVARTKVEPLIRVVPAQSNRQQKRNTAPPMKSPHALRSTMRESILIDRRKSSERKLPSLNKLDTVSVTERKIGKSNEKESNQVTAQKSKWRISTNLKDTTSSRKFKEGSYATALESGTKMSTTSLQARFASSRDQTHKSPPGSSAFNIQNTSESVSLKRPQQSMTQIHTSTISHFGQFATVSDSKPKPFKDFTKTFSKKLIEKQRKSDVSYLMDDYSTLSPHTRLFYKEINDEMNRIVREEEIKKSQVAADQRSLTPPGSIGERSVPFEHTAPVNPYKKAVGGPKGFNLKSYTSIDATTLRTSDRFIKDVLLPNIDQKNEKRADFKAKREVKGSFLDLLLDFSNIMPQDDAMLKDLLAKVPGGLSEEPAGRRAAMLTKKWIIEKQNEAGKLDWPAAELAIIEVARQVYLSCSERGECILMALSAYKQASDEREQQRIESFQKLKAGLTASSNNILAEYNEREKRTVISLAEALADANSTKKELDAAKIELASLEASCMR